MKTKPIVSFCIPTYNRCQYLEKAIESIVTQKGFDDRVELVISDNASDDKTQEIVEAYLSKYPNIKYSRNKTNLGFDRNFELVLAQASGTYLKIYNDYVFMPPNSLELFIETIEKYKEEQPFLFFNTNWKQDPQRGQYQVKGIEGLLREHTFYISWIWAFGLWQSDFDLWMKKSKQVKVIDSFIHLSMLSEVISDDRKVIIDKTIYAEWQVVAGKGRYSLFDYYINRYLNQFIVPLYKQGRISWSSYMLEKHRLLREQLYVMYKGLVIIDDGNITYGTEGARKLIVKNYWKHPSFYYILLKLMLFRIKFGVRSLFK